VQEGVYRKVYNEVVVYRGLRAGADVPAAPLPCYLTNPAGAEYLGYSGSAAGAEIGDFHFWPLFFMLIFGRCRAFLPNILNNNITPRGISQPAFVLCLKSRRHKKLLGVRGQRPLRFP
jgi:hypothetical protein